MGQKNNQRIAKDDDSTDVHPVRVCGALEHVVQVDREDDAVEVEEAAVTRRRQSARESLS